LPDAGNFWKSFNQLNTPALQLNAVENFFDSLLNHKEVTQ